MDNQKVSYYLIANGSKFPEESLVPLKEKLVSEEDSKEDVLMTIQLSDPNIALILSLVVGTLGIDRFYLGDTGLGVLKLLTCGGCGVWTIIDWFLVMDAARRKNLEKIFSVL